MGASARAEVFARLYRSSGGASAPEIDRERESLGSAPRPAAPAVDTTFLRNVLQNHGTAACAPDRSAAVREVGTYLYENLRSQRLVAGHDPRLAAMPWRDAGVLPRFGALEPGEEQVALSWARLGIAEMGAVVTFTGRANPSADNLLPEHHIVIVDTGDLVADAEEAWLRIGQFMAAEGRPRGINFIAGPSSTADIEGRLVYGAHGPRCWHVILIGEGSTEALERARAAIGAN
ncbi:MAG: LUD domain-containing protein [Halioglobus sp.]|nr:LUD domain-containing protein [Halioglobus sp.]